MRGMAIAPHVVPAQPLATRIQQELCSLFWLARSHGKLTLIRPHLSQKISSLGGPTTVAVCGPSMRGLGHSGAFQSNAAGAKVAVGAGQRRLNHGVIAGAVKAGIAFADSAVNVVHRLTAFQTLFRR